MSVSALDMVEQSDYRGQAIFEKLGTGFRKEEVQRVKEFYSSLGRNPSEVELETIAQTWSEHCFHKTFKGEILTDAKKVRNLLSSYIKKATQEIDAPWCISTFEDNAGIVKFWRNYAIAAKVETHNHPSVVEPFGGAATGVGGVIRDILGVWATPIACTDVLGFAPPSLDLKNLSMNIPHPKYLMKGVVSGIAFYGNNMGIPTVNGSIVFDESYAGYAIVVCGCFGILNTHEYKREGKPGDSLILVGGRTGRDGIHGVTFASAEILQKPEEARPAVQIPDPIQEEKLQRAILRIAELKLSSAITDLGGGGLSCAVCEMARNRNCGAKVNLDKVPLKAEDLSPWEIWVSESQERMLLAVPAEKVVQVMEAFAYEEVESVVIGELTRGDSVLVFSNGENVAELDLDFLFHPPEQVLTARLTDNVRRKSRKFNTTLPTIKKGLLKVLSSYNVGSKESVIRTYDHEVKGNTVVKPLQPDGNGPNDACVLKPVDASNKGIVISNGVNPSFGRLDAYAMAASCIDEAVRNNVAAGGRRICLLDNFIWPSPERPEMLGALVRAAEACYEVAKELRTPFISGKDSLYNESSAGPITPTLVITALGTIPDICMAVTSAFKTPGNPVYIVGNTYDELGGSEYYKITGNDPRGDPPIVRSSDARENFDVITKSIDERLVAASHDISQGGLASALAEMTFANNFGADVDLSSVPTSRNEILSPNEIAFSESNSRFVVEVAKSKEKRFEKIGEKTRRVARVGWVSHKPELRITYGRSKILVKEGIARLRRAWCFPLGFDVFTA